jgi:hypothetical protein
MTTDNIDKTIGSFISLIVSAVTIPQAIDTTWKINMKEIHSKCSKHCIYRRMIDREEMEVIE